MPELTLKQGDTTPELQVTLENPAQEFDGSEMVRFYMEGPSDSNGPAGDLLVNAEIPDANIEYQDPENPEVTYDFEKGDTSQIGTNKAEVVVTYADGEVQSFPDRGQFWNVQVNEPTNREVPPAELDPPDIEVGVVNGDVVDARTLRAIETLSGALTGGATLDTLAGPNLSIEDGALVGIGDTQLTGEQVRTEIAAFLRASGATSIAYDDANDELTISSTDENTQRSDEEIEDVVGALLSASGSAAVEYDDSDGTLTIGATDTDTQLSAEEVQDIVGSLIAGDGATSVNYDDQNGTLTVSSTDENTDTNTQLSDDQVQDIVGGFISGDGATSVNYDDQNGTLTVSSTDTDTNTQLSEGEVQTIVEAYLSGGTNVQISASSGELTIAADHDHAGEPLGTEADPVSKLSVSDLTTFPMEGYTDVLASRTVGNSEHNDTGHPLSITLKAKDSSGGRIAIVLQTGPDVGSDNLVPVAGNSDAGDGSSTTHASVSAIIPPGNYYRALGNVDQWYESRIGSGG